MINISNIKRYDNVPFDEYLKLPGYSHSWLKQEYNGKAAPFTPTDNMRIGSLVDQILTEPSNVAMNNPIYPYCRDIARKITTEWGFGIKLMEKQVSLSAEYEYSGVKIPVKGRLDFGLPSHSVVDLKITKMTNIQALINFMGYKNQIWHYAKMYGVDKAYLLIYSIPKQKTELHYFDCSGLMNDFWAEKILKFGN